MKKVLGIVAFCCITVSVTSCGGTHGSCAAYHSSDYTAYRDKKDKEIRKEERKAEKQKTEKTKIQKRKHKSSVKTAYLPKYSG